MSPRPCSASTMGDMVASSPWEGSTDKLFGKFHRRYSHGPVFKPYRAAPPPGRRATPDPASVQADDRAGGRDFGVVTGQGLQDRERPGIGAAEGRPPATRGLRDHRGLPARA